ncbi:lipoate--protein ligase [Desulfatirhabdium butyrativorans]|uniref:lipoate--protein ligase n=1 Tax=Desulfatirhabdium butyrativorans TaxID=340467 RepID=UPI00048891C0|nr:lipoate--protein ligase [Desulfatirhabdium butyrativorans]
MLCLISPSTSPAFNLGTEEYLLTVGREDCFLLWQSDSAVIVGRNQNAWAEVNASYIRENRIPVIRRLSGGGAVYHDGGNINFTFIRSDAGRFRAAFTQMLNPVVSFLQAMGVPACLEGVSDLAVEGRKISGNAQCVHRGRLLHHGTLLFDSDLAALSRALRVIPGRYIDKAVPSIRKPVTNIRPWLKEDMDAPAFMERLLAEIQKRFAARRIIFSDRDRTVIRELAAGRYDTWEWNFGHGPPYRFQNTLDAAGCKLTIAFDVRAGRLGHVRLTGSGLSSSATAAIEACLTDCRHDHRALREALLPIFGTRSLHGICLNDFLDALF